MKKLDRNDAHSKYPQLSEVLDHTILTNKLQSKMGAAFTNGKCSLQSCQVRSLRYKPGKNCLVVMDAHIQDHEHGIQATQIFKGKILGANRFQVALHSSRNRNLAKPAYGPPLISVPEWNMLLWAYPNDPELPGLSLMADEEQILAYAQTTPSAFGLDHAPSAVSAKMMKYVPGKRCGYLYRLTLPTLTRERKQVHVYGKAYQNGQGEEAYQIMQKIWLTEACRRKELIIPQPYSFDQNHKILWQEALQGRPLAKEASDLTDLPAIAEEIGRRLAGFHQIEIDLKRKMTLEFQVDELKRSLRAIVKAFPDHADRCRQVVQQLIESAPHLQDLKETPVHASFKFSHIFLTAQGIAFIDFDGTNIGDPGHDVGRFIAHLYKMRAEEKLAPAIIAKIEARFCHGYNEHAAQKMSRHRINWFAAGHIVSSQIYKLIKRAEAAPLVRLIELAEEVCPSPS